MKRWFTPRDTLQTIDMIDCILTGFMKKMQCNALNIKTVAKQVWFYFIRGTTRPGYAGTITNLQIVLNTQKNPYLNQATQKNTCQNFPTQKHPEIENFKPKKSFDHPCRLKSGVPPLGLLVEGRMETTS